MYDSQYHVTRPVVWDEGVARDLGTLGGPLGAAAAMNPSGTIVGVCQPDTEYPSLKRRPSRACVWKGGAIQDLGDLGGPEAAALDVNNRGWIVGFSTTGTPLPAVDYFEEHAFLFDGRRMRDLGTLGGPASIAYSLNNRGEIVGFSYPADYNAGGALSWSAFVWRDGAMHDLDGLGGPFSVALDINDRGDIVGWSFPPAPIENWPDRALLWRDDEPLDLNDLVPDRSGCILTSATSINNAGDILANARCDYKQRVVLLTPYRSDQ
jgi:probable HAF family extracellular repeat protein